MSKRCTEMSQDSTSHWIENHAANAFSSRVRSSPLPFRSQRDKSCRESADESIHVPLHLFETGMIASKCCTGEVCRIRNPAIFRWNAPFSGALSADFSRQKLSNMLRTGKTWILNEFACVATNRTSTCTKTDKSGIENSFQSSFFRTTLLSYTPSKWFSSF